MVILGCGGSSSQPDASMNEEAGVVIDAAVDAFTPDANPLATLAGTGLCVDAACTQISPDVMAYAPRFELWSDTATKRRWIYLPPNAQIDTTDMDYWKFPVGTKVWKEFTRDGTRVETRYIVKLLADDDANGAWFYMAYQWNAAQDAATAVPNGVEDANGTAHNIPSQTDCRRCHDDLRPSRVLGVGAIQLDYTPADATLLDLEDLIAQDKLTAPPTGGTAGARFPLPGSSTDHAALGYMHANCGGCHNPSGGMTGDITPMDLRLRVGTLATVQGTPAYTTTFNVDAAVPYTEAGVTYTKLVIPDDPTSSSLTSRMTSMNPVRKMPALGTEVVDPTGHAALVAWINSL